MNPKKIISLISATIMIAVFILFITRVIPGIYFWISAALMALVAYYIIPKMK